jgi:Concanavalin A-like lectin/glucanases superfamily
VNSHGASQVTAGLRPGSRTRFTVVSVLAAGSLLLAGPVPGAAAADDVTSPATPDVELLGDPPKAGEPATLRFTSSDPDSGLDGFWYGIQEEVKRDFVAAPALPGEPGSAEITFTVPADGGHIFVFVWAEDIAGNDSNRATFDFFAPRDPPPPPEAVPVAGWPLGVDLTHDAVGDNDLTVSGIEGTDYNWVEDRVCRPGGAWDLHGSAEAYARSAGAVVATDESFSVAAWVLPGAAGGEDRTVLSQSGAIRPAMLLEQTAEGGWRFAVPNVSPVRPGGVAETAPGSVIDGMWNHLAGVLDLVEGELRLYVNGELAATGEAAAAWWPARGPFNLGVAGSLRGVASPYDGTIDVVQVWSGRLLDNQIASLGRGGGLFPPCF